MALPEIVSREDWLTARKALLEREKAATRARDVLNADRRRLPMVRVEREYEFEGAAGKVGIGELFGGRRQLIVQHVMFHPDWEKACPSCTAGVDEFSPALIEHLHARETEYVLVARAPFAGFKAYADGRGWFLPVYSSYGGTFNYDYNVTLDAAAGSTEYNYRDCSHELSEGEASERPGMSCFLREGDEVFHTYSAFQRGVDFIGGAYPLLDLTALGRQEAWEEPKGRYQRARGAVPDFAE